MDILVVEDDVATAGAIKKRMEIWDHNIEIAGTGKDALKKVSQKKFDVLLLDIFLPDCWGYKLIQQFKELRPDIGIVTMTGYNSRELELEVRQQGIIYYMIKPINTKELKEIIDHLSIKKRKEVRKEWQN